MCLSLCGGEGIQHVGGGCCVEGEQTTFRIIREPGQGLGISITGLGSTLYREEDEVRLSLCGGERIRRVGGGCCVEEEKQTAPSASSGNQAKA